MARKEAPYGPASSLEFLLARADAAVLARVQELLKLDDAERLALLIAHELNPAHIFTEAQEAMMRGVSPDTLRGYKSDKILPAILGERSAE